MAKEKFGSWYKITKTKNSGFCKILGPYATKHLCIADMHSNSLEYCTHSKPLNSKRKAFRMFHKLSGIYHHDDPNKLVNEFDDLNDIIPERTTS